MLLFACIVCALLIFMDVCDYLYNCMFVFIVCALATINYYGFVCMITMFYTNSVKSISFDKSNTQIPNGLCVCTCEICV